MTDLNNEIALFKTKKAIGNDNIANELLKKSPEDFREKLLETFNTCWREGYHPKLWKIQLLLPFLKQGKDPSHPASYRPISLISCLGKVFEGLIQRRLSWWVETQNLLPDIQNGFRKNRSTVDNLLLLEHEILLGYEEKKVTLVVFFDLANAFDRASHLGILYKLKELGIRGNSLRWFKSFLTDREFEVLIGITKSTRYKVVNGVPQGSILSPLLFTILLSDIPLHRIVKYFLLADDLTFSVTADTLEEAQILMQSAVNRLIAWTRLWGLIINPEKTKVMCFTNNRLQNPPTIKIGNREVTFTTQHKCLGVILNGPKLTWKPQIENLKNSCLKRLNIMKRIASRNWGLSMRDLLHFYKTFIRGKIAYAVEVYSSAAKTTLDSLKVIETTALRLATGAFKTSPRVSLYAESNILPLPYWIKHRSINYFLKIQQSPLNHPLFQIFTQNVNRIWRTDWTTTKRIPFLARIKTIIQDFNLNIDKNAFTPIDTVSPVPPWRNLEDILKPTFAMPKDKTNSISINKEFQKICREDYKDFLYIYRWLSI